MCRNVYRDGPQTNLDTHTIVEVLAVGDFGPSGPPEHTVRENEKTRGKFFVCWDDD